MPLRFSVRLRVFQAVVTACILFVVLTLIAMLFYPGGTDANPSAIGYQFFNNFFSELGLTHAYNGESNTISFALFTTALATVGLALGAFFIVFAPFFTRSRLDQFLAWSGSIFGVVAGGAFVGIALIPVDVDRTFHIQLVQWAFQSFFVAVLLYLFPLFRERRRPRPSPFVFLVFVILLGAYVLLLMFGPNVNTPNGLMIQATGQKIIVYASIISILYESLGAIHFITHSGRV